MNINESLLITALILFNILILFLIIIRLQAFAKDRKNLIAISFLIAFVCQELFTIIIQFGPRFDQYVAPWVRNLIGTITLLCAAYFFYEFATRLYLFAAPIQGNAGITQSKRLTNWLNRNNLTLSMRILFFLTVFGTVILEAIIAREASNSLTMFSVDIKQNIYLLANRFSVQLGASVLYISTAATILLLVSTSFGKRRHIAVRSYAAVIGAFQLVLFRLVNLGATAAIFYFPAASLTQAIDTFRQFFEKLGLIPLAFLLVIAAGPVRLVSLVDHFVLYLRSLGWIIPIQRLRNLLTQQFPEVVKDNTTSLSPMLVLKPNRLRSVMTAMAIECTDALHILFGYVSLKEVEETRLQCQATGKNLRYPLEAQIVSIGLIRRQENRPAVGDNSAQSYQFPTKRADTLVELLQALVELSRTIQRSTKADITQKRKPLFEAKLSIPLLVRGLVSFAIGMLAIWLGGYVFLVFVLFLSMWLVYEILSLVWSGETDLIFYLPGQILVFSWLGIKHLNLPIPFEVFVFVSLVSGVLLGLWRREVNSSWLSTSIGHSSTVLFVSLLTGNFLSLRNNIDDGFILLMMALLIAWGSDLIASLVGRKFGRHLLTQVSPRKTWEGALAGVCSGACLGYLFLSMFLQLSLQESLVLLSLSALISPIGDLSVSIIKRYAGVRHSGSFFGEFGGILDKMGSVLFVTSVIYFVRIISDQLN